MARCNVVTLSHRQLPTCAKETPLEIRMMKIHSWFRDSPGTEMNVELTAALANSGHTNSSREEAREAQFSCLRGLVLWYPSAC